MVKKKEEQALKSIWVYKKDHQLLGKITPHSEKYADTIHKLLKDRK